MWLVILKTQEDHVFDLVDAKKLQTYMNMKRLEDATTRACFCRKYADRCSPKLREFINNMTPTQRNYYARQDVFELVCWFNRVAGVYRPLPSESDLIRADVQRGLAKLNVWKGPQE